MDATFNTPTKKFMERILAMEVVRVTERAAVAAACHRGQLSGHSAVDAAAYAMFSELNRLPIDGLVVTSGEGERNGGLTLLGNERVGSKGGFKVQVAVDPLEGRTLCAANMPGSISVVALAESGTLLHAPDVYMDKIAIGPGYPEGVVDLDASAAENVNALAKAKGVGTEEITVLILDRPRHERILDNVRQAGANVRLITDGDIIGAIQTANPDATGVDIYLGLGGAPEGVLAAAALRCVGGQFQGRLMPTPEQQEQLGSKIPRGKFNIEQIVRGDCLFAATGVTDSSFVRGVRFHAPDLIETETVLMRSTTGTVRRVQTEHRQFGKFNFSGHFERQFADRGTLKKAAGKPAAA